MSEIDKLIIQVESLGESVKVLTGRLEDVECGLASLKKPKSRFSKNLMIGLLALSASLAVAPKDIVVGDISYTSGGIPLESITAIAGIIAACKFGWDRVEEDSSTD